MSALRHILASARPRALAAAALVTLLAGCQSLPPVPASAHRYAGRFSLAVTRASTVEGEPRRQSWSGRFALAVAPRAMALDLVSPLGATIARFETDAREARLVVPAEGGGLRVEHGPDAQALSEHVLGWSLPIAGMADWVEGRPASDRRYSELPPEGGHDRFEQDGWAVTVAPPEGARRGLLLQMERPARADAPAVVLRVVLDGPDS